MSEKKEKEATMTPEELAAQRKNVIQYYKNQIDVLQHQAEYEKLLADIEEQRTRRVAMIIKQAQMTAGPEPEQEEDLPQEQPQESEPVKKERKLKSN